MTKSLTEVSAVFIAVLDTLATLSFPRIPEPAFIMAFCFRVVLIGRTWLQRLLRMSAAVTLSACSIFIVS